MNNKIARPQKSGILLTLAAFMVVVAGLRAANDLVVRFLLAFFIAFICGPFFFWLNRRGLPRWLALVLVLIVILGFGALLGVLIGTSVNDFTHALPTYQANFVKMVTGLITWLNSKGIEVPRDAVLEIFNPNMIMNLVGSILTTFTGMLSDSFLILLIVIFVLMEASGVPLKVASIWGDDSGTMAELNKFADSMQRYITLKTLISLATGIFISIFLIIIGVDFPLLWGLLAFLLNYIPTIGSILASIPPILLALIQMGLWPAVIVLAVYLAVNNVIGGFIEPRTMGKGLGISPLIVLLSVIFWGWVLGPVGMLLSVPLTMSIKIYLESRSRTRWIAVMLSRSVPKKD
ncbi:AI-2E family transporter [candidate division KSB1 bacterium]|nr:AI-2E family transporter [candidate division KSB1 bacterium]RQW00844.1 MAG: AI-2E family transporter [candidate division KSB1 bacterium]